METNPSHRAEQTLGNSQDHHSTRPEIAAPFAWLAAALLILIGAAFELGMFGFGPYNSSDAWLFSSIGRNLWIMLTNLIVPELREFLNVWPLLLVSLGSAILLVARFWNRFEPATANSPQRRINHAN
jgi:hypothetical protein